MKKMISMLAAVALLVTCMAGCGAENSAEAASQKASENVQAASESVQAVAPGFSGEITVISREEGSGTRGAFVELMGIEDDDGDHTTETAEISNSTSVVSQTVSGNPYAIGYISMGAMSDSVKAVKVDGVEPNVEQVKAGAYSVARPFEVCYQEANLTELGRDFITYIMSAEGQKILSEEGYISVNDSAESYTGSGMQGSLSLNGSTSVAPVMEVLAEAYRAINPDVTIDIQQTGSGAGITAALEGSCEIGMSSRALKDEELASGLTEQTIAMDGIAVIVNRENPVEDLTSEQIRAIFVGQTTQWDSLG